MIRTHELFAMKRFSIVCISFCLLVFNFNSLGQSKKESNEYVQLSMNLISAIQQKGDYQKYIKEYNSLSLSKLAESLDTDNKTKAFWINTYNAYVQILLTENPSLFKDRNKFFKANQIKIGGQKLSLDFIEHGIIRGSKVKLAMGYINDPFASTLEKQFRVDKTDGRIHFALNCGAISCPAVAIYSAKNLDQELDQITQQFLHSTTKYNKSDNTVYVTSLFNWYRGDFSEQNGVIGFLRKYKIIPEGSHPLVKYQDYDWTLDLGNFTELK